MACCGRRLSVMSRVKAHCDWDEVEALFASVEPPTTDDVSIAEDGRRLDSAPAVRAFFDELKGESCRQRQRLTATVAGSASPNSSSARVRPPSEA